MVYIEMNERRLLSMCVCGQTFTEHRVSFLSIARGWRVLRTDGTP